MAKDIKAGVGGLLMGAGVVLFYFRKDLAVFQNVPVVLMGLGAVLMLYDVFGALWRMRRDLFAGVMMSVFGGALLFGIAGLFGFVPGLQASAPGRVSLAVIIAGVSVIGLLALWFRESIFPRWEDGKRKLDL